MVGTIDKIEFTLGGFGNQFTTIDGRRYWTWWEAGQGVRVGARVEYDVELNAKVWDSPKVYGDVATIRRVLTTKALV